MDLDSSIKTFMDTTVIPGLKQIISADYQSRLSGVFGSSTASTSAVAPPPAAKKTAPPPAAKKTAAKKPAPPPAAKKTAAKKPGEKRTPDELNRLVENLHAHIVANPGSRMEAIAKGMKKTTSELNLPIKKLAATKRITTTGEKRATAYTAA